MIVAMQSLLCNTIVGLVTSQIPHYYRLVWCTKHKTLQSTSSVQGITRLVLLQEHTWG